MALLNIDEILNDERLGSRFKLVHLAGLRARELNSPEKDSLPCQGAVGKKVTTRALTEIVNGDIDFIPVADNVENDEDLD